MAVRLRLSRHGTTNSPFYWMVAADSRFARDGRYLEKLGFYNPLLSENNPERLKLNKERIEYWLSVGASTSERALKLLRLIAVPGLDKFVDRNENKSTTGDPRTTKSPDKLRRNKKLTVEAVEVADSVQPSEEIAPPSEEVTIEIASPPAEVAAEIVAPPAESEEKSGQEDSNGAES